MWYEVWSLCDNLHLFLLYMNCPGFVPFAWDAFTYLRVVGSFLFIRDLITTFCNALVKWKKKKNV